MIYIAMNSLAHQAYGKESSVERFQCQYGLNDSFKSSLSDGNLKITGFDKEGHARIIELQSHPFFLASLFLPQMSSQPERPHPLIHAFIKATTASKFGY